MALSAPSVPESDSWMLLAPLVSRCALVDE
jgi:hypothetical protein